MGLVGGAMRAAQMGNEPDFKRLRQVKNQGIETGNVNLLGDWNTARTASGQALADWTAGYLKSNPAQVAQETSTVDRYYNGEMDRILASNRASRAAAMRNAADRALAYGTRRQNASMLGGGMGGDSSYNRRLGIANATDVMTKEALDQVTQERADLSDMEKARLGLIGARSKISTQSLLPSQLQAEQLAGNTRGLAGISAIDLANTDYGLWNRPGTLDQLAVAADAVDSAAMTAAKMYAGGGMELGGFFAEGVPFMAGEAGPEMIVPAGGGGGGMWGLGGGGWSADQAGPDVKWWGDSPEFNPTRGHSGGTVETTGGTGEGAPMPGGRSTPKSESSQEGGYTKVPAQFLPSWSSGGEGAAAMARLAGMPSYAGGGVFTGEGPMLVGENGPEVVVPTAPGVVIPNNQLQNFARTGVARVPAKRSTMFSNLSDQDLMRVGRYLRMAKVA